MNETVIQGVSTGTFQINSDFADVGGEDLDLKSMDLTDTLLGSAAAELSSALGEADMNGYESYHQGDTGISDIELTTFDSALLKDAGIKVFKDDKEAEDSMENTELASVLKMPKKKEEKKEKNNATVMDAIFGKITAISDDEYEELANDDRIGWGVWQSPWDANGELEADGADEEFTDADFDDSEGYFDELESAAEAYTDEIYDGLKKVNPFWV